MQISATCHGQPRKPGVPSEDAFAVRERNDAFVAAIADGVGTSLDGRAAAALAVRTLTENYLARPLAWPPSRALREFAGQLNERLHAESIARHGRPELLCTLSAIAIERETLRGLNIGDSPVYVARRGRTQRLSKPHVVGDSDLRHGLTRALGMESQFEPHEFAWAAEPGDVIMLCSDGVADALGEERVTALLAGGATARIVVAEAGAVATPETTDDFSAIVVEIHATGEICVAGPEARPLEVVETPCAGDEFDGFTLERELQGGGRVWLANGGAGRCVVKFPPREARTDEAIASAFVREAWNAVRLGAEAGFTRAWVPEGPALRCYAMDYVDAPTLRDLLHRRPLVVEETIALGRFLLGATTTLLRNGLVHGDIKPENILALRRDDAPTEFRLLDLGSAAPVFASAGRAGTASYLAPERFSGAPLTERTEIFAIGVTLYEALTRTYPYGDIERFQTPRFDGIPKAPARLNSSVPPWLDAVVLRALSVDPELRHQAYSEMLFDLENPDRVQPFHRKNAPWIERNPLGFYRTAFFLSLLADLVLIACCHGN